MPRLQVVGRARDGVQALDAVRRLKPDVVTLDIGIPKMDGIEVLKRIKAEGLDCKGIVLTANIDEECRRECLDLGATHVFDKVMQFDEVMQTLRAL
jgi:two-component system KDP operon response regulator KdpE